MNKLSDSTKLVLSAIVLFGLIIFSYQKNAELNSYRPFGQQFKTPIGTKSLNSFNQKIKLMYFGFLNCPDACPTTLSKISKAFKQLTPEELNRFAFIFVDLDPTRDSLDKLKEYTNYFHPNIIAFTTDPKSLEPFTQYFGIAYQKVKINSEMGYTIDHSTDIVVVSPKNEITANIHHEIDDKLMLKKLRELLKDPKNL